MEYIVRSHQVAVSPEHLGRAQDAILALQHLLHEVDDFSPLSICHNPSFHQWNELLSTYHTFHGTLHIGLTPYHFWLGQEAWHEVPVATSMFLSSRLFQAGLRSWSMEPQLDDEEHLRWIALLAAWWNHSLQDNLLSVLWEQSFHSIDYDELSPITESSNASPGEWDEMVHGLYELQQADPAQKWNFVPRGFDPSDSTSPERASDSIQELLGETFSLEEKAMVQDLLASEEEQIPLRASDLFLLVLMHCKRPEDIAPLQSWTEPIARSLLVERQWYALVFLSEDLQRMVSQLPETIQPLAQQLLGHFMEFLCSPEQLMLVAPELMKWSRLPVAEQGGMRNYLRCLAAYRPDALGEMAELEAERVRRNMQQLTHSILRPSSPYSGEFEL
ncbi:MAG: hypothetical protein EP343_07790 [Deltaproteobacteria bacterium]|nr:MAG: hypothetical protein EP343_07790 [Deltaproteobacteria bacterium]